MCCLNFYWVQFLVLLLLYLVDVLSELLLYPVPGITPVLFGVCVVWTFLGSSSLSNSRYIRWMFCLNFCRIQFLILLPLYLVDVLSELCRVQFLVLLLLYLVYVLSELLWEPFCGFTPVIFGVCVVWTFIGSSSWFYSHFIWWMCCLNFCWVQFLVLLPLYLVDVLYELL